jgi:hypothetical protein
MFGTFCRREMRSSWLRHFNAKARPPAELARLLMAVTSGKELVTSCRFVPRGSCTGSAGPARQAMACYLNDQIDAVVSGDIGLQIADETCSKATRLAKKGYK